MRQAWMRGAEDDFQALAVGDWQQAQPGGKSYWEPGTFDQPK
jgi:hypothetical protein